MDKKKNETSVVVYSPPPPLAALFPSPQIDKTGEYGFHGNNNGGEQQKKEEYPNQYKPLPFYFTTDHRPAFIFATSLPFPFPSYPLLEWHSFCTCCGPAPPNAIDNFLYEHNSIEEVKATIRQTLRLQKEAEEQDKVGGGGFWYEEELVELVIYYLQKYAALPRLDINFAPLESLLRQPFEKEKEKEKEEAEKGDPPPPPPPHSPSPILVYGKNNNPSDNNDGGGGGGGDPPLQAEKEQAQAKEEEEEKEKQGEKKEQEKKLISVNLLVTLKCSSNQLPLELKNYHKSNPLLRLCILFLRAKTKSYFPNMSIYDFLGSHLQMPKQSEYIYFVLQWLDNEKLIEHGTAIRCAWLAKDVEEEYAKKKKSFFFTKSERAALKQIQVTYQFFEESRNYNTQN